LLKHGKKHSPTCEALLADEVQFWSSTCGFSVSAAKIYFRHNYSDRDRKGTYRVCHGSRFKKQVAYFRVDFDHF